LKVTMPSERRSCAKPGSSKRRTIAFSNARYYGGRLVTFPSPVTDDRAVRLTFVPDGVTAAARRAGSRSGAAAHR
jgi:hypothetical protein